MDEPLEREERLRLIKLICSFAWADRQVQQEERTLVERFVGRLELDAGEMQQVQGWLSVPPDSDTVDPRAIPTQHRVVFIEAVESMILADGEIAKEERDLFLRMLTSD